MTFSDKLHISEVQIKEPEDESEWIRKFSEILLSGLVCDEETNDNPPAQRRLLALKRIDDEFENIK